MIRPGYPGEVTTSPAAHPVPEPAGTPEITTAPAATTESAATTGPAGAAEPAVTTEPAVTGSQVPSSGPVHVQPDLTHLAFEVDSLEEFGRHLARLGLKYSDGPTTTSTGTVFAFIDAPEGYEIELIQRSKEEGKGGGY